MATTSTTSVSSSGAITVSGVGSGIDTSSIVTALVNSAISPKQTQITKQETAVNTTLSGIGSLKSALEAFQTASAALNNATTFMGLTATSSSESYVKATSDNTASPGTYTVAVSNVATASKVASQLFSGGAKTAIDAGTLSITQGSSTYSVTVGSGATLSSVRDSINSSLSSSGISANIVTDSNGSRLVLTSTTTGAGTDISVSGIDALTIDGTSKLDTSDTTSAGYITAQPVDANYSIDGLSMTSSTNNITSAVSGLSLTLTGQGTSTITVASDSDTLKTSVQSFVDAYNTMMGVINAQTAVTSTGATSSTSDSATTSAGALTGDATVRKLVSQIHDVLSKESTSSGTLSILSQLGVGTNSTTGLLSLDDTKWTTAMNTQYGNVASLFTGSDGIITRMNDVLDQYTQTGGILATRQTSLNAQLSDLDDQQEALDRRQATLTTMLTAKYTAMDTLVAQLNSTSSSVLTTLNSLNTKSSD